MTRELEFLTQNAVDGANLPGGRRTRGLLLVALAVLLFLPCGVPAEQASNLDLTLADLRQRVLQRNETIQARLLSYEARRHRAQGEYGVFEPDLFASFSHEINNRKNTAEQQASLLGAPTFTETNNNYEGGVEGLIPSGARVRLGYTLRDLNNSLQPARLITNGEYQTFFGLSVAQPLLKNFGPAATMAGIRIAAISNKMAFQEYRRDLMTVVSTAEAMYWNLYLAQEQVRFFEQSIKTAEHVLHDNRTRFEAGKGSELEVLEAEAGLAVRRAKHADARQKLVEAANRVITLYAQDAPSDEIPVRAVELPQGPGKIPDYQSLSRAVLNWNPDYLLAQEKLQQDMVRLGFARNQRLPDLALKGTYGLNGLGRTPDRSWEDVAHQKEPSWSVGVEFRVPLGGGIKSRNELTASRLELEASQLGVHNMRTEILNGMNTTWRKLQSIGGSIGSFQTAVKYNQSVLDAALTRLEAGKLESRKVLEIEGDVLEASVSATEAVVRFQLALLELEVVQGVLLQHRQLELTQAELQEATARLGTSRIFGDIPYREALGAVQQQRYQAAHSDTPGDSPEQQAQRVKMREERRLFEIQQEIQAGTAPPPQPPTGPPDSLFPGLHPPSSLSPEAEQKLREELRKKVRESEPPTSSSPGKPTK